MSETVVRKQRRKRAGVETPHEFADRCDEVQRQLRSEFYARDTVRHADPHEDGTPAGRPPNPA